MAAWEGPPYLLHQQDRMDAYLPIRKTVVERAEEATARAAACRSRQYQPVEPLTVAVTRSSGVIYRRTGSQCAFVEVGAAAAFQKDDDQG